MRSFGAFSRQTGNGPSSIWIEKSSDHVLPGHAGAGAVHNVAANTKLFPPIRSTPNAFRGADLAHDVVGKNGVGVSLTLNEWRSSAGVFFGVTLKPVTALFHHVLRVVGLAPDKKMGGINARRVVAAMKNAVGRQEWANVHFVGNAVSQPLTVNTVNLVLDHPVSNAVGYGLPFPTSIWRSFLDLFPKPDFQRGGLSSRHGGIVWVSPASRNKYLAAGALT